LAVNGMMVASGLLWFHPIRGILVDLLGIFIGRIGKDFSAEFFARENLARE